ncbi:ATP cone domain-containing protein [Klebsiella quasipneumoniae]|uniref:ATP cone domain-containing protein n=1 Tax=Klebsiella quasipneumoniae TaxID=1463165 RepID=UPI001C656B42|nr:ATP cone domain-containing protein [Klebsiella quasipneumoniae]
MKPIVIKRDGSKAPFNRDRIQAAVESAAEHADQEIAIYALNVALAVELKLRDYDEVHITEIQTLVENELMLCTDLALARSLLRFESR